MAYDFAGPDSYGASGSAWASHTLSSSVLDLLGMALAVGS